MKFYLLTILSFFLIFSCSKKEENKFDKIIFHQYGQYCFGECPTYHFEIDKNGYSKLHIEEYPYLDSNCYNPNFGDCRIKQDSTKIGFYKGKLTTSETKFIFNYIDSVQMDTMQNYRYDCNDDISISYLYFTKNKSKKLLYECPSVRDYELDSLTNYLQNLVRKNQLKKTKEYFRIEDIKID